MKILYVEDNEADGMLMETRLLQQWPEAKFARVETREPFIAQLTPAPDVIVSDWNLPKFSGREALDIAQQKAPDTPFIFLSGGLGEETAVEALKAGAVDYVLKDRPQRLVPAIERAVREARLARERNLAAETLRRVERLENIGILAGGLAHDFNNALAPVLMAVTLLKAKHPDTSDQRLYAAMESSAQRGTALAREIRKYVEGTATPPQRVDLPAVVTELTQIVAQGAGPTITVRHEALGPWRHVEINPLHLHQVILNLCANAREAMPQGGSIVLRTSSVPADLNEGMAPGNYVLFEVQDSGIGIPAGTLDRIWTPFFTTKPPGYGHGLGLATVRSIVQKNGGRIDLRSTEGKGTLVQVWLPAAG